VAVDTLSQLEACIRRPEIDLIYLEAGSFISADLKELVHRVHKGSGGFGKLAVLRLPQIFRNRDEAVLEAEYEQLISAGFDAFLAQNPEEVLWLKEKQVPEEMILTDHSIYIFNTEAEKAQTELLGKTAGRCYSLEMNLKELRSLSKEIKKTEDRAPHEMVVYGRAPLMVTAQCMRKTTIGCDKRPGYLYMKDRTGAVMPVRNSCRFCQNTIFNALPTVLFDLKKEIAMIGPDSVRYEFTIETEKELSSVLDGVVPKQFTRGHFHRGVE